MRKFYRTTLALIICAYAIGCGPDKKSQSELNEGYASLESRNYDSAINRADSFLQHTPNGPGTAEALYLRGRALEQKPALSRDEAMSNLSSARTTYLSALTHQPSPKLESYIRTSIGNVAYFEDDYNSAAGEWTKAYDQLGDDGVKAWVLYRIGVCRQRLGQFAEADAAFNAVMQRFPTSVPAQRAKEHVGVHEFRVQLATFGSPQAADIAITALRHDGVNANRNIGPGGKAVLSAGPVGSYQQAQGLKMRYAAKYPDAIIVP